MRQSSCRASIDAIYFSGHQMEFLVEFDISINCAGYGFFKVIVENLLAKFDGKVEHELVECGGWACRGHGVPLYEADEDDLLIC